MPKPEGLDLDKLEAHPFADIFQMLDADDAAALAASIRRDGLLEKIVIFNRKILDGRNRYRALKAIEEPLVWDYHFEELKCDEKQALDFVESKNVHRRHMSAGQRSMAAADFVSLRLGRPPEVGIAADPQAVAGSELMRTEAEAAGKFGTTAFMVAEARKLQARVPKHVSDMVRKGELNMHTAKTAAQTYSKEQLRRFKSPDAVKRAATRSKDALALHRECLAVFRTAADLHERPIEEVAEVIGGENKIALERLETCVAQLTVVLDKMRGRATPAPAEPATEAA